MTDRLFNELLDAEVQTVGGFYLNQAHYEPRAYVAICAGTSKSTAIRFEEGLNPGDNDLLVFLRKLGARFGLSHGNVDPMCIFIVQPAMGLNLNNIAAGPKRVLTLYGVTNDARYNLAVMEPQLDEDGRLYLVPLEVHHWGGGSDFAMDIIPFLQFFEINEKVRGGTKVESGM